MEPPAAAASVADGRCEVWRARRTRKGRATSSPRRFRIPADRVKVNVTLLGGGFGRKSKPDYVVEAALLSRAVGAPIKVTWTREDEIHHDYYHTVTAQHLEAALDPRARRRLASSQRVPRHSIDISVECQVRERRRAEPGCDRCSVCYPEHPCEKRRSRAARPHRLVPLGTQHSARLRVCSFAIARPRGRARPKDYLLELLGPSRRVDAGAHYQNYGDDINVYPIDTGRLRRAVELVAEKAQWGRSFPPATASASPSTAAS